MAATVAEHLTSVKRASDGMPFEVNQPVSFVDPQSGLYTDGVVVSFASSTAVEVGYAGSGWSDPKYNKVVLINTLLSSLTKSTRTAASKKSSSSTSSTAPSAATATATTAMMKGEPVEEEAQKMSHGLSTCASLESLASVASSRPKLTHRTSPTTSPEVKEVNTEDHCEPPCHESLATTSLDVHEASAALAMLQHALPPKTKPSQSCEVCGRGGGRPMLICRKCRKGVHKGCLASPNPQSGAAHVCPKCQAASVSPNFNPTSDPETPARTLLRIEDSNEAPQASDRATKPPTPPTGLHLLFSVLFDKKENKSSSSMPSGSAAKKPSTLVSREDGAHRSHHAQSNKRKRAPSPPAQEGRKPHELSSFNRAQAFLLRNPHDPAGLSGLSHPKPPRTSSSSPAPTSNDRSNAPPQRTSRWSTASSAQRKPGAHTTSTNTTTTTTTTAATTERITRPLPPPPPPSISTSTHTQTHTRTQTDAPIPAQQRPPSSSSAAWSEEDRWNAARAMMGIRKTAGKSCDADVKLVVPPSAPAHGGSSPQVGPMGERLARNADAAVRRSGGDAGDGTQGQGLLGHQQQQQQQLLQRRPMHEGPHANQGLGARVKMKEDVSEAGSERDMTTYDLHMSALLTQRRLEQRRIAVEQQRQQQHQQQQEATLARLQRACVGMDERRARDTQQEDAVQAFLRHHHQHQQQQQRQQQQQHQQEQRNHYQQQQQQRQERGQGPVLSSLMRVKTPDESPRHRRSISSSSSSSSSSHDIQPRHSTTLTPSSSSASFMSSPSANVDPAVHHHLTSQLHEDQRRQTQQLRDIERAAASSVQALAAYRALKAATTLHGPYEHGIDVLRGLKAVDAKAVLQGLTSGAQSNSPFLASSAKQQAPRGPMRPSLPFSLVREHKRQQTSASLVGDDDHEPSAASYKKFKWAGAF